MTTTAVDRTEWPEAIQDYEVKEGTAYLGSCAWPPTPTDAYPHVEVPTGMLKVNLLRGKRLYAFAEPHVTYPGSRPMSRLYVNESGILDWREKGGE